MHGQRMQGILSKGAFVGRIVHKKCVAWIPKRIFLPHFIQILLKHFFFIVYQVHFVYTNYDSAELFVNGVSQGIQTKTKDKTKQHRYRLMWMDVKYKPGTLKVVAFDDEGNPAAEKEVHTAGKPHHLELSADRKTISADGTDLSYFTVSVVDKDGNLCPNAENQLNFKVSGAGKFKAVCNGDATSLEMFHLPTMKTFSGKLVVTVQSLKEAGEIELEVKGKGLKTGKIIIQTE